MQLFSRLGAKRSLGTLNLPLFSGLPSPTGGLCPGDIVELCGGEGSGKSELLLNITAQCVLPRRWCAREIGGREVEVVWVSTDHKFDVLRLVAILEGKVCGQQTSGGDHTTQEHMCSLEGTTYFQDSGTREAPRDPDYEDMITSCLSRVHVVYCNSSSELGMTLQSLRLSLLRTHPDVCTLVLDNIAEFYWVDRAVHVSGSEARQAVWVDTLRVLIEEHHLVVFAAKPLLFAQKPQKPKASIKDVEQTSRDKVYTQLLIRLCHV